ncbi:MAG: hypothetical protein ACM3KD_10560 [Hyphomicrobiaceae bacterium]
MIKALASATLLLMLAACGSAPVQPVAGDGKPSPAGPPPPPMPDIPLVCPADVKLCSDGRSVGRNPARECEFDACPGIAPQ